jgi:thiamine-phosphate pyrophosphorylase
LPPNPKRRPSLSQPELPRLYAIVDADLCAAAGRAPIDVARAFLSAGAKLIQLRCKSMASGPFLDLAIAVLHDARRADARIIINDRADIAVLAGAHGVHVGQTDLSPLDTRRVVGPSLMLGLSTHTAAQWESAVREPVSYIAIGPVFGSGTKDTGYTAIGLETVARAAAAGRAHALPTVAIGGITAGNAKSVIDAGAASVAVISDLLHGDPEARCMELLRTLE